MRYRILVVDDMKSIHTSIANILSPRGCEVAYANSGAMALEMIPCNCFDLIILDIHLPDANGIDVCKAMREIQAYKFRPIILLTSDTKNLEAGLKAGATDYVLKPFNEVEMIARVFTQISLSRHHLALSYRTERLEREFNSQKLKLKEVQNDLQRYFYQTSHKLRSPLNSIKGLFNLLKVDYPALSSNPYLELIESSVARMTYVNEQVSRIGYLRAHKPCFAPVNLFCVLSKMIERRKLHNKIVLEVDKDVCIHADEEVLIYGLEPIMDNAIFYGQLGKLQLQKIRIVVKAEDESVFLVFQDFGPGIKGEDISKIFDMFYIGDNQSAGNGLGLFISRIALELLGLTLKVQSKEGYYTRIFIDITKSITTERNDSFRISA